MILRSVQWHRARASWGDMNPEGLVKDISGEIAMVRGWGRIMEEPLDAGSPESGGRRLGSWGGSWSCQRFITQLGSLALSLYSASKCLSACLPAPSAGQAASADSYIFKTHQRSLLHHSSPPPHTLVHRLFRPSSSPLLSPFLLKSHSKGS